MKTSKNQLPESRVRIDATVDAHDVDHAVEHAAGHLASDIRIPGFRKGKVPPRLVIQRLGYEAVFDSAMREFLPSWYEQAVIAEGIRPLGDPNFDVESIPAAGEEFSFSVEVAVTPTGELGEYKGLEVPKGEVEVPADQIDAEIDRLRDGFSSLSPVERGAEEGDVLLIDYTATAGGETFDGSEASDFTVSLTEEGLNDEFRAALTGAKAGEEHDVKLTFPEDHEDADLAGKEAVFKVTVKEVRERIQPELDDDFALQASEFDTLEELRNSISDRLAHSLEHQVEDDFRRAAIDAAAANIKIELPDAIVEAQASEGLERMERTLAARGIDSETYMRIQGKTREELIEESLPDAANALRRDALLDAVAEAENIEVTEEELLTVLASEENAGDPVKLLADLRSSGRDALLIRDMRSGKAADLVVDAAKPVAKPAEDESGETEEATG